MRLHRLAMTGAAMATLAFGQSSQTVPGPATVTPNSYVPGTTYESVNPNYMTRNPYYFEGRVDWNLLKITNPANTWEFVQRGIHEQDDLQDTTSAIADFQQSINLNSFTNGTCQIVTVAPTNLQNVNPPPCMFTPRLRLAHLVKGTTPTVAIGLFQDVLKIDPLRLGINAYIGDVYVTMAGNAADQTSKTAFLNQAVAAYKAELVLSPVTAATIALTGDKNNNEHVHWSLSEVYAQLNDPADQATELQAYLDAAQWHSDTYAWHIQLAKTRLAKLAPQLHKPVGVAR